MLPTPLPTAARHAAAKRFSIEGFGALGRCWGVGGKTLWDVSSKSISEAQVVAKRAQGGVQIRPAEDGKITIEKLKNGAKRQA